jgi:predicted lipoprotein with Yx(FWY)xxD motif
MNAQAPRSSTPAARAAVAAAALIAALLLLAAGAEAAKPAKVGLRHTSRGNIFVAANGHTLYEFTHDHTRQDSCVKISGCPSVWPPLLTSAKPVAGTGVQSSMLSTITLANGRKQVAYGGHALYVYSADSGPGETLYVGEKAFGGSWYGVTASAHAVK